MSRGQKVSWPGMSCPKPGVVNGGIHRPVRGEWGWVLGTGGCTRRLVCLPAHFRCPFGAIFFPKPSDSTENSEEQRVRATFPGLFARSGVSAERRKSWDRVGLSGCPDSARYYASLINEPIMNLSVASLPLCSPDDPPRSPRSRRSHRPAGRFCSDRSIPCRCYRFSPPCLLQ